MFLLPVGQINVQTKYCINMQYYVLLFVCRNRTVNIMIRVGIIGVTGYVGIELLRLLQGHPLVTVTKIFTNSHKDEEITAVYPHLKGAIALKGEIVDPCLIQGYCDVVFMALPHGHAITMVPKLLEAGVKIIDLSGDFRLKDAQMYQHWYQHTPAEGDLLQKAIYGLPEVGDKSKIKKASLIANPGCYPTAILLAAAPAIKAGLIDVDSCIFDAKSGVSGAGRTPALSNHFCEVNSNLITYKLAGQHRHVPEIEQELSLLAGKPLAIQFTPHLIPVNRGLQVTSYFKLINTISPEDIHAIYQTHYQDEDFIRIMSLNEVPQIKHVSGTNFCDIGIFVDKRTQRLLVVSVIDNLIKGAGGQAIQNMNLMYQFEETMALKNLYAMYP